MHKTNNPLSRITFSKIAISGSNLRYCFLSTVEKLLGDKYVKRDEYDSLKELVRKLEQQIDSSKLKK